MAFASTKDLISHPERLLPSLSSPFLSSRKKNVSPKIEKERNKETKPNKKVHQPQGEWTEENEDVGDWKPVERKAERRLVGRSQSLPLLHHTEVPPYLRIPYIQSGYRLHLTYSECVHSFFTVHNETGNVWTHFFPAFYFSLACPYLVLTQPSLTPQDTFLLLFYTFCCLVQTLSSAFFHLFLCHSLPTKQFFASLDYVGIAAVGFGGGLPGVLFGFQCHPFLQKFYLLYSLLTFLCSSALSWSASIRTNRYLRSLMFVFCGSFGVVFSSHLYLVSEDKRVPTLLMESIAPFYFFLLTGFLIYFSRVPERYFPGVFDYWGQSHQVWHMFVSMGEIALFHGWLKFVNDIKDLQKCSS